MLYTSSAVPTKAPLTIPMMTIIATLLVDTVIEMHLILCDGQNLITLK